MKATSLKKSKTRIQIGLCKQNETTTQSQLDVVDEKKQRGRIETPLVENMCDMPDISSNARTL